LASIGQIFNLRSHFGHGGIMPFHTASAWRICSGICKFLIHSKCSDIKQKSGVAADNEHIDLYSDITGPSIQQSTLANINSCRHDCLETDHISS